MFRLYIKVLVIAQLIQKTFEIFRKKTAGGIVFPRLGTSFFIGKLNFPLVENQYHHEPNGDFYYCDGKKFYLINEGKGRGSRQAFQLCEWKQDACLPTKCNSLNDFEQTIVNEYQTYICSVTSRELCGKLGQNRRFIDLIPLSGAHQFLGIINKLIIKCKSKQDYHH